MDTSMLYLDKLILMGWRGRSRSMPGIPVTISTTKYEQGEGNLYCWLGKTLTKETLTIGSYCVASFNGLVRAAVAVKEARL